MLLNNNIKFSYNLIHMRNFLSGLFFLLLLILPQTTFAVSIFRDSIPLEVDGHAEYYYIIQQGIGDIIGNNSKEGVALLNKGLEIKNKTDNKNRIFEYFETEFSSLVAYMNTDQIKPDEFDLGVTFLKEVFLSDKQKIHPELITRIQKFVKLHPKSVFALRLEIYTMDNVTDVAMVEKKLSRLLKLDPTLVGPNLYEGKLLFYMHLYKDAISCLNRAIMEFPEYALAYQFRGLCYMSRMNSSEAMADFNKAIELYPDFSEVYNNRGFLKTQLREKKEALADYRKSIEINPNNEWPYNNIGLIYASDSMSDSALYYFQEALDVNPDFEQAYENMGRVYYNKKDFGEAIHVFTKCIGLNDKNVIYYNERGDAYFYGDNKDEALSDYKKALELDKKNVYALLRLGDCYQFQKSYDQAIQYYDQAIAIQPLFKYAYVDKALCFSSQNKNEEACDALIRAVKIDSTYSPALGNLGWIYYCLGDFEKCISYSQRAIRFENDAYYAMFNIAIATLRLGKVDESKNLYRTYVDLARSKGENLQGAMDDLQDLIKKNIMADQAGAVLKDIFEKKE